MRLAKPLLFVAALGALAATGCGLVTQPGVRPIESTPVAVDAAALERHVRTLAVDLRPRSVDNLANLDRAAEYVRATLAANGATPELQSFDLDGHVYRNVIARFGPRQGPLLVIGAHYDSNDVTPGADDNASGVAGLLELARLLAAEPPAGPVELVAFTLEEPPYFRTTSMGSFRHAQALDLAKREVRLMLSLEMIGYFRDEPGSQRFPVAAMSSLYPDTGNFITIVGRFGDFGALRRAKSLFIGATDLPVRSINAPTSMQGVDFSDHASYWHFGMPAVMVTDTAFFRNPNYHAAGDVPESLDFARMAKVVQGVYAVAKEF